MKDFTLKTSTAEYLFTTDCGGFPSKATVIESDGSCFTIWNLPHSVFSVQTADGTVYHPAGDSGTPVRCYSYDGAKVVELSRIPWKSTGNRLLKDLYLSLKWEFFPDGAVFCDLFLFYASLDTELLQDFKLTIPLDFSGFDDMKWSFRKFPGKAADATVIQEMPPERFLPGNDSRTLPDSLFTQVNFNAMRKKGPSFFAELLLEGNNSLFNYDLKDTSSSIISGKQGFTVEWNFQTRLKGGRSFPALHWRNRFGMLLRPAPVKRNLPPMHIYHYIDNFKRFPSDEQIRMIAESGASVLILHDCWRFDTQNGGIPYDESEFHHGVALAHQYGLRVVLYLRGNEISVREDAAGWFDTWLLRNFDGLYMDYGGPFGYMNPGDENFPGGRIAFREYYKNMRALRERVGKNGIFYSHTGTGYSGIATSFFDGYVSGEGERGILIHGRREHEYFSMTAVSPGTMWTAAFPEYSSPRMIPFLAAAAQSPHIPLGKQIKSSSLQHPPVPGISDTAFRKLLSIWSLLGSGRQYGLEYYTDFNSRGIFCNDPAETAHCLILAPGKTYGIMTLSNCSGKNRKVKAAFQLHGKFSKYKFYAIPGEKNPAEIKELEPFEVVGAIVALNDRAMRQAMKNRRYRNQKSEPEVRNYLDFIEKQKALRIPDKASKRNDLIVFLPTRITSHERSLMNDLYDVAFELRERLANGKIKSFGYISKQGLLKTVPQEIDRLHPGDHSEIIDLSQIFGSGKHVVEIYSTYKGEPFYSFIAVEFASDIKQGRIEFVNELEEDRAILHWNISVKHT